MTIKELSTDVLIIGGGTAGCYAAYRLGDRPDLSVLIAEKANIERSGCLAAGVNALNAYITEGHTPMDYVEYAKKDADGIVREDLLLSMSEELNLVTKDLEDLGLVILKDKEGRYVSRGWRNIKINGENIKPLLAGAAASRSNVSVLNHVNITDLLVSNGTVVGAVGFSVREPVFYRIHARAVLIATGGAAGLYRPNNPGFSRHKMWYCPFNTGSGYSMGIRAGAEMTSFEMRFIALRCKDTIAPTGTLAQGVGAKQVNALGEVYETRYGLTTSERVYGTVEENRQGRGPCYLRTKGITDQQADSLYRAYLNMAPAQTLKWMERGAGPAEENVEFEGTEPYIVGGHTGSGFWVGDDRSTTLPGLFAAGDAAGGAPQKYVTGALAEGKIAAKAMEQYLDNAKSIALPDGAVLFQEMESYLQKKNIPLTVDQLEEAMQKTMDKYAGGIRTDYRYNEARLTVADRKIAALQQSLPLLSSGSMDDLLRIYELRERLVVCRVLIAHLRARKETRWHCFAENADYPEKDPTYECYVNSVLKDGEIHIIYRDLVKLHEHTDQ